MITLQKKQKNASFRAIFSIKNWKAWKIMAVPNFRSLENQIVRCGFASATIAETRLHFTVQN